MRVHDYPGFPNPARVRIALAERMVERTDFVTVDAPAGELAAFGRTGGA